MAGPSIGEAVVRAAAPAPVGVSRDVVMSGRQLPLSLTHVSCCVCGATNGQPIGVGEDFEYHTSPDSFLAMRCRECGLVYLDPRPTPSELPRIYPREYHAFDFSAERYGFVYRVRRALEARRAMQWCKGLPPDARILDVGCGDGFHLRLLRDFGPATWSLEGVDASPRAAEAAREAGLTVHEGTIENASLRTSWYDLVLLIATIEHVDDPPGVLRAVQRMLRPGGRVVIVTDNTATLDFAIFGGRHWGGYHFPRHFNLFNRATLTTLATRTGFEVDSISTVMSPVNWVYSIRNTLVDWRAPSWLVERFSLHSPVSLGVFTIFDTIYQWCGAGALLRAVFRRPIDRHATSSADEPLHGVTAGPGPSYTPGDRPEIVHG
jgi:SAM-dependent methyltransferase